MHYPRRAVMQLRNGCETAMPFRAIAELQLAPDSRTNVSTPSSSVRYRDVSALSAVVCASTSRSSDVTQWRHTHVVDRLAR
eukprot:1734419-Prymnesium_polylepis.1